MSTSRLAELRPTLNRLREFELEREVNESRGPAPTVTLASDASNSPAASSVDEAEAQYGPGVLFRSGPIKVTAKGALGSSGYATTSSSVTGHPNENERPGPFLYDGVKSRCSTSESGTDVSVTITNGFVQKHDPGTGEPMPDEPVPTNPAPGHTIEGTMEVGDDFRITFNEQVMSDDGSLTVYAAHLQLLGPTAVGDLFIAQSVCGITSVPDAPSDALPDAMIRLKGKTAWLGDKIIDTTGRDQTAKAAAPRGERRVFQIKVRNDGKVTDSFRIAGPGKVRGFVTHYMRSRRNVTDAVASGRFRLKTIDPGKAKSISLVVKVRRGAAIGKIGSWRVTATSLLDSGAADAVRAKVKATQG